MPLYGITEANQTLNLDSSCTEGFDPIANLGINQVIGTVQSLIALPYDCKIVRVVVAYSGVLTAAVSFNIVVGTGAAAALPVGTTDANAPQGTAVFSVSPTLPVGNAGNVLMFAPDNVDVIYQSFNLDNRTQASPQTAIGPLSLRFVTNGTGGITGITKVVLGLKPINQHAQATGLPSPAGNYTDFDTSLF